MQSLFELNLAEAVANLIDSAGKCDHKCMGHVPLGIGELEAKNLGRFDPESLQKLQQIGTATLEIEIEDLEHIAQVVPALNGIKSFNADNSDPLYKHAIAVRLNGPLLIANGFKESDETIEISKIFGHDYFSF